VPLETCASLSGLGLSTAAAVAAADWTRRRLDLGRHALLLAVPVAVVLGLVGFAAVCGVGALVLDTRDRRRRERA
jgi:hypothetical protein